MALTGVASTFLLEEAMHRSLKELSHEQQRGFIHGKLTIRPTSQPRLKPFYSSRPDRDTKRRRSPEARHCVMPGGSLYTVTPG